ncbi:HlyD family secretion protein [Lysobacter dokdonensis DS-58]|uniref:HlyD family secretion protein n=1 Tax=Lysobacter dokdonensis DS-58 TaxID=1300345 RepID=A0A0A2X059_9GAMM|nr:HlyD family efflux transporter periplasmic adaptor subunit [Lysobacter dokdonensis]KGQ18604.1 HlyD family secretion protein [Lysobacter dokdonensis DS-58]
MTHDLFRREVLEAKGSAQLGGITLAQPLRMWTLTLVAVVAALAVVAFLLFGGYSRRSRVVGQLVPSLGLATVTAPASGVVAEVIPQEGDPIVDAAPLLRLSIPRALAHGEDALATLRDGLAARQESVAALGAAQRAQLDAQQAGTHRQLAAAHKQLHQTEAAIATRREQVRLGRVTTARYARIAADQYVSQAQLDQQAQAVLDLVDQQQALEREATTIRRGIMQMEQALQELPAQRHAKEAATQRDLAQLQQERVQQEAGGAMLVKAPVGGLVANRLVEPGQAVQAGQPLLTLLPQGSRLQAQLLVPSRAIGFIEPGSAVLLRYQAYPYQKFGHYSGRVVRVSRSVVAPTNSDSEPVYRVLVELDAQTVTAYGKPEPLRAGMVLEADILSERRRLYEWLLEPLYSVRGVVGAG